MVVDASPDSVLLTIRSPNTYPAAARRVLLVVMHGEGKIYGSEEFVRRWIVGLGNKFNAMHVAARAVGEIGFSSHGWRIAAKAEKSTCVA